MTKRVASNDPADGLGWPAWDIGMVLTRHETVNVPCARVLTLRRNVGEGAGVRLDQALATACTCGAGDSQAESTSR